MPLRPPLSVVNASLFTSTPFQWTTVQWTLHCGVDGLRQSGRNEPLAFAPLRSPSDGSGEVEFFKRQNYGTFQ